MIKHRQRAAASQIVSRWAPLTIHAAASPFSASSLCFNEAGANRDSQNRERNYQAQQRSDSHRVTLRECSSAENIRTGLLPRPAAARTSGLRPDASISLFQYLRSARQPSCTVEQGREVAHSSGSDFRVSFGEFKGPSSSSSPRRPPSALSGAASERRAAVEGWVRRCRVNADGALPHGEGAKCKTAMSAATIRQHFTAPTCVTSRVRGSSEEIFFNFSKTLGTS